MIKVYRKTATIKAEQFDGIKEIWRPVKNFGGLYEISNLGRVRGLNRIKPNGRRQKGMIRKSHLTPDGYVIVGLSKNGKSYTGKVHRMVATAFLDNPNNLKEINHIDEDKTNNNVNNLEWCDRYYNIHYGSSMSKYSKPVVQLTLHSEFIRTYASMEDAHRHGYSPSAIAGVCTGKYKQHKGFKWKFLDGYTVEEDK